MNKLTTQIREHTAENGLEKIAYYHDTDIEASQQKEGIEQEL